MGKWLKYFVFKIFHYPKVVPERCEVAVVDKHDIGGIKTVYGFETGRDETLQSNLYCVVGFDYYKIHYSIQCAYVFAEMGLDVVADRFAPLSINIFVGTSMFIIEDGKSASIVHAAKRVY